jgi:HTH-type transcriptional regulator, transcriptional repressor of NAD biosynthesis genes
MGKTFEDTKPRTMRKGLVLGKFMPFHQGHAWLIDFSRQHCDFLYVLVCATSAEPITGSTRFDWVKEHYATDPSVKVILFEYNDSILPNTSESSAIVSSKWAAYLSTSYPDVDVFFSSEPYGDHVASHMGIEHIPFDIPRLQMPVSGTLLRSQPFQYWQYLPAQVRPFFVKKVCLIGTESTGKTTLTQRLADYFQTTGVPEAARDIVAHTDEVTMNDLHLVAVAHAKAILAGLATANKLLFVDTNLSVTKSYACYLFNQELQVESWIEQANQFDLLLYLDAACEYVQDGTRLAETRRNELAAYHEEQLKKENAVYFTLKGNWDERFDSAIKTITTWLLPGTTP